MPPLLAALALLATPDAVRVELGGRTFTVPAGFTVEQVAGPPLVNRPVTAAFDDAGRLYVADSSGSNASPASQWKEPTHRVVRLTASRPGGPFDAATVFADKLPFLQGTMWRDGSLYVAAPPRILKLTDADGDGVAERRETWWDGAALTGCANDVHGPYPGPDGLIYWTKGAFARQELTLKGRKPFRTRAAHIYRSKPDGTDLEVVMTGGMDNPVDVAFLSSGDLFFTTTFFQHPANGRRDGIVHNSFGSLYGKDHDAVREQPWGVPDLAEPTTHLGPAAPAGLHAKRLRNWGAEYADNLFCAQFNLAKVSRHVPAPAGATFRTADSDFLTCEDREFRPTDVLEDPAGDLLVLDTGGWYKLCCPSSVTEKKEVLGGIYRVRRTAPPSAAPAPDVRLTPERRYVREAARGDAPLAAIPDDELAVAAAARALIDAGDLRAAEAGLASDRPAAVRAAAAALAQMPGGRADRPAARKLAAGDARSRAVALRLASLDAELGGELADAALARGDGETLRALAHLAPVRSRLAGAAEKGSVLALTVMAEAKPKSAPPGWHDAAGRAAASADVALASAAVRAARALPKAGAPPAFAIGMLAAARNAKLPPETRLHALALAPDALDDALFDAALAAVGRDNPGTLRAAAVEALTRVPLSPERRRRLAEAVASASPLELERLLAAFGADADAALLRSLASPAIRAALRPGQVAPLFRQSPADVRKSADALEAELASAARTRSERIESLLAGLPAGDARRGASVFHGAKAACAACHRVGYVGGGVGPDLTKVGAVRSRRDLLEAVAEPSASFVRSYEPFRAATHDGRVFNGVLKTDAPDEVVLAVSATEEVRLKRDDVESLTPGAVSVMPAGLDKQLTPGELADLLAFLGTLK